MLYIKLEGHEYRYEISELIKLFTSEFSFLDNSEVFDFINDPQNDSNYIINRLIVEDDRAIGISYLVDKDENIKEAVRVEECCKAPIVGEPTREEELDLKKKSKNALKKSLFPLLKQIFKTQPPWGVLTGIRPTKIIHELMDRGYDSHEAKEIMLDEYLLTEQKAELCRKICALERKYIYPTSKDKVSLYISIPFCSTRCNYCSFPSNSLKDHGQKRDAYIEALTEEMKGTSQILRDAGLSVESFYIGGGTPTALDEDQLKRVIDRAFTHFDLSNIKEFTVEAGRVDTIDEGKLRMLKAIGVDRISINPQTMNDETLAKIGRAHKSKDIEVCFYLARELGFDNINMDIILGLVDETPSMVAHTLERIVALGPENLTVHTLAIKKSSEIRKKLLESGEKEFLTEAQIMEEMLRLSYEAASDMGMNPYYMYRQKHVLGNLENIGYAKEGCECLYNMQIMEERQTNIAIGAGAVSKFVYLDENRIERVDDVKNLDHYISRVDEMIEKKKREAFKNGN